MSEIRVTRLPKIIADPSYGPEVLAEGTRAGLAAAGGMAVGQVRLRIADASPRRPQDTGLMAQSIGFAVAEDGKRVLVGPSPATLARTAAMEEGRRPGARCPPVSALAAWARRKGLLGGFTAAGRRRRVPNEEKALLGLAFALAKSIARKGIKARRFFRRAVPAVRTQAPQLVAEGIRMEFLRRQGGRG